MKTYSKTFFDTINLLYSLPNSQSKYDLWNDEQIHNGVFAWGNSRGWFISFENLKFFVMKCFVWIEKLKNI